MSDSNGASTNSEPNSEPPAESKLHRVGRITLVCILAPIVLPLILGEIACKKARKRFRLWRTRNDGKLKAPSAMGSRFLQAIRRGDDEDVAGFLQKGVDAESVSETGISALHLAVEQGMLRIAEMLLKAGANPNNPHPVSGETTIIRAVRRDDAEMTWLLICHKASLCHHGYSGQTPLLCAVNQGSVQIVQMLIESGADPNHCAPDGRSARDMALKFNRNGVSRFFKERHIRQSGLSQDA